MGKKGWRDQFVDTFPFVFLITCFVARSVILAFVIVYGGAGACAQGAGLSLQCESSYCVYIERAVRGEDEGRGSASVSGLTTLHRITFDL